MKRALVVSTIKGIYNSWGGAHGQIESWQEFADLRWTILHGAEKEQNAHLDADIFLLNPDGLKWFFDAQSGPRKVHLDLSKLRRTEVDFLIVDESTDFKNSQSLRFRILKQVVPLFKRRMILTGTPTPKGLEDLFSQVYILDEGASLGAFITHYRQKYFYQSWDGFSWLPQPDALEKVTAKISPLVLRLEVQDAGIELPELITDKRYAKMPEYARKIYDNMENDLISILDAGEIIADNQAVASGKCRQICAGALYNAHAGYEVLHRTKLEMLADLLDELAGSPVLLFYQFQFEIEMLKEKFPKAKFLNGGKYEPEIIDQFNEGNIELLCGQPSSSSKSINLQQSCGHVVWLSQTWKADDHRQGIDRVRRQGNPRKFVVSHYLLMEDTIDDVMFDRNVSKDEYSGDLSAALKRLRSQANRV